MNAAFTKKVKKSSILLLFLTAILFGTNLSAQWTNYCIGVNATNNTDCTVTLYCDETADGQSIYNMGTIYPGQTKTIYPSQFGAHVYAISNSTGQWDSGIYANNCGNINYGIDEGCSTSCDGQITGLQINPQNGGSMINLMDGETYCESDFTNDIRLRALASGSHESLRFTITGAVNSSKTENYVTYDSKQFWANPGTYYVNVKLYSQDNLGGTLCDEKDFSFTVEDCEQSQACNVDLEINNLGNCPVELYHWVPSGDIFTADIPAGGSFTVTSQEGEKWRTKIGPWNNLTFNDDYMITGCDNQIFNVYPCPDLTPTCDLSVAASAGDAEICDGGSTTISATASGANTCSEVVNYYQVVDTDPTCSGVYGQGVIFRRAGGCQGNHEPWTAGSDLYFTEYADGTAIMAGSIHNGGQTGTVYIEYAGKANSGQNFNGGCYVNNLSNVSHYYTGFWGTITVGGTEFTVEPKTSGVDFVLGHGAGNDGNGFGMGGWTAGTWGGCTEFFINLEQLTIPAGNSDITYAWSGPNGFSSTEQSTTVSESGTYTISVTDCAGCTATDEVVINVENATASITANGGPLTCTNSGVELIGSSTFTGNGVSYAWTGPNGFVSNQMNVTVSTSGTYVLTATKGACTADASVTVMGDTNSPTVSATGGAISCVDMSTQLTSSGTNIASYAWTGPGNFSSTMQNPTATIPGEYTVTVTAANGCTASASAVVEADLEGPGIWGAGGTFCEGTTFELVGSTDATNGAFTWTGPGGFTSNQAIVTVSLPGTYTLTVVGDNGCSSSIDAVVTLLQQDIPVSNNGPITCTSGPVQISASGANVASYSWTGPNGFDENTQTAMVNEPGVYTVSVIFNNGCSATASTTVEGAMVMPMVTATAGGIISCEDASVQLTASGSNIASYSWTGPNGFASVQSSPTVTAPGTYTVTATSVSGCTATATAVVDANISVPTVFAQGAETCSAAIVQLSGSSSTPGVSYSWAGPNGFSSPAQNPFVSVSGTYTLTITAANGCTASTSVEASLEFLSSGINVTPASTCTNDPMPFQAISAGAGATYSWSFGSGATPATSNNLTQSVTWNTPGTKTIALMVTKGNCTETYQTTVDVMSCQIDLDLSVSVDESVVAIGEDVTWTIVVNNEGPSVATGVMVSDVLPDGVTYLSSDPSQGTFNPNTGLWNIGTIPVNGTVTLTVTTSVDEAGTFVYIAEVATHMEDDLDSTPGNDNGDQSEDDEDSAIVSTLELAGLGDYVYVDLNQDGSFTTGEPALEGVVVKLFNATDLGMAIAADTTGANGLYQFLDLDPNLDYVVQFMMAPTGYALTTQSGTASAGINNDSDAGTDGFTDIIDLNPGEYDSSIDAGYILKLAQIGDYTWIDTNGNGIQDPGEDALAGIIVQLFEAMDLLDNQDSATPLGSVTTGTDGAYSFSDLDPALDYVVQFTVPEALSGYVLTVQNSTLDNGDDTVDSDPNPATGYTDVIMVDPCDTISTVDAGFTPGFLGQIDIKALLEGAVVNGDLDKPGSNGNADLKSSFGGKVMHDQLRAKGLIPTTDPYSGNAQFPGLDAPVNVDPSVFNTEGAKAPVDFVVVTAYPAADPMTVADAQVCLILRDGSIVSTNGVSLPTFDVPVGNYYVSVRHRNHLAVMSADAVALGGAITSVVDFRDPATATWGDASGQADLGGVMALHLGDYECDNNVSFQGTNSDINKAFFEVLLDPENTSFNINHTATDVYSDADVDLDGEVQFQGANPKETNNVFFKVLLDEGNVNAAANYTVKPNMPQQ